MFTRLEIINGKLAVSAMKAVAVMKASDADGEKFNLNKIAITMGVNSSAAPSIAKKAEIMAPNTIINGNKITPRPLAMRATCKAAQPKKPASSNSSEMIIKATNVKVASQTMSHTIKISDHCTTPTSNATAAPPSALQPMPRPRGCQITNASVMAKILSAVTVYFLVLNFSYTT